MEPNENEYVEHIIRIDDYMEVRLKIKRVLDAMELHALTLKASKMFNLSEVAIDARKGKQQQKLFDAEAIKDMVVFKESEKLEDAEIAQKINEKYNSEVTEKQVRTKIINLKSGGKWAKLRQELVGNPFAVKFTPEMESEIVHLYTNKGIVEAEKIKNILNGNYRTDLTKKQVSNKIHKMKGLGKL